MSNNQQELWKQREVDVQFLLDSGLMFEANRHIFHPIGLALVARKSKDGTLHLVVKDMRATPEKAVYNKEDIEKAALKYKVFMKEFGYEQCRIRDSNLKGQRNGNKKRK